MLEDVTEMFKFKIQLGISIVSCMIPVGVKSRGLGLRRSFRLVDLESSHRSWKKSFWVIQQWKTAQWLGLLLKE